MPYIDQRIIRRRVSAHLLANSINLLPRVGEKIHVEVIPSDLDLIIEALFFYAQAADTTLPQEVLP